MEFQSLTPPPGNHNNTDMALTLTSTPNSYGAMKFSASESQYKHDRLDKPKEKSLCNSASSVVKSNGPESSIDSDESDDSSNSEDRVESESNRLGDLSDDNEPVDCDNCNLDFPSMQAYMEHTCAMKASDPGNSDSTPASNDGDLSEGESFDGKIVYNSDGSAYIIEGGDSDLSDLDSIIDLPNQENIIVDKKGSNVASQVPAFPHIANAFFVSKNFKNMYSIPSSPCPAPIMFSYRVYDVRRGKSERDIEVEKNSTSDESLVPTKPILMCFICKLSFGYAKSFMAHASSEHSMSLNDLEKDIMSKKNASAIIQCVGMEKEPLMSFLEPKPLTSSPKLQSSSSASQAFPPSSIKNSSYGSIGSNTSVSFVYSKPKLSSPPFLQLNSGKSSSENSQGHSLRRESESDSFLHNDRSSTNGYNDDENSADDEMSSLEISGIRRIDSSQESSFLQKMKQSSESFTKSQITSSNSQLFAPSTISVANPSHSMMFLTVCDEHPQGRVQGVECPKCDMVLGSSQSLGGHMTMMHSRNSCKTLKCPKCNWHYKYQETLEIHMKEKHPDNDQQCMYCISSQPHPRLARGESYSCGYKPYRCEVCNYSTTTKGNLSIHMQSDKHLNNVQELANGNAEMKIPQQLPAQPPQPPAAADPLSHLKKNKPKPTWRCDVCNYETNVARNLRIHMTSEKHTHNMMVLQQNMKHMQRDMQIQQMNQLMLMQNDPAFLAGISSPVPGNVNFQFDQSMIMAGLQGQFGEIPVDLRKENGGMGMSFDPHIPDASRMFQCCVCNQHATDSLENLHQHLQHDRTKHREQENIHVSQGTYICNLCQYKTQLKANFQLHCKTDKHLQRLQLVNHIKEGGPSNEWRLKYLNVSNPVQVRCNACDYYTNSIHKLQIHTGNPRHESNSQLFRHLQHGEGKLSPSTKKYYHCALCSFSTRAKQNLIQHVRSMKHMHNEGLKQIQMKEQNITEIDPGEIFMVKEYREEDEESIKFDEEDGEELDESSMVTETELPDKHSDLPAGMFTPTTLPPISKGGPLNNNNNTGSTNSNVHNEEQIHVCPYCDYSSASEMRIQGHIVTQHTHRSHTVLCPLCQEEFKDKSRLERHLMSTHSVKAEGLQRLLMMVDKGDWMPSSVVSPPANQNAIVPIANIPVDGSEEINLEVMEEEAAKLEAEEAIDISNFTEVGEVEDQYRCQTCSKTFNNIDGLYAHQNELGHLELKQTPRGPGYLCWKKGCNQYFKTAQALQVHFREIHAKCQTLSASDRHIYKYKCTQCSLAFKNQEKLQLHSHYHLIRAATKCNYCGQSFSSVAALRKHVEAGHTEVEESDKKNYLETMSENSEALVEILSSSGMEKLLTSASSANRGENSISADSTKSSLVCSTSSENTSEAAKTDLNSNETQEKSDRAETSSPTDSEKKLEMMDTSDSSEYKDQQFLEDYMNSQAIAEGGYEDPSRKFKCHRCKVAFTKQNYLTAHNKTLLHRKGDKMSYPMEKYLDPNRPFKCDVCKESFTQKNILVVHYNSVSHLHKVKQALQQGEGPLSPPSNDTTSTTTTPTPSSETQPQPSADDKNKLYKCNICKVSYSQGSTLDIHIRSVGHQSTAAKLPELILSGQIDLSQPLIEQPNDVPKSQQQKLLAEMLQPHQILAATSAVSQPSLLFPGITSGIPAMTQLNMLPGLSAPATLSELTRSSQSPGQTSSSKSKTSRDVEEAVDVKQEQPKVDGVDDAKSLKSTYLCNRCNAVFINQENLAQHQMMCLYQPGSIASQNRPRSMNFLGRKTQVQKNLLENIGFECVMQFNEFNQPSVKREVMDEEDEEEEGEGEPKVESEKEEKKEVEKPEKVENNDLPELNKSVCVTCKKEFSSVWVLKSHQEEVHKEVVPINFVENLGEQFKTDYEKKQPKELEKDPSPAPSDSMSNRASETPTPTMESNSEMPPPPPPSSSVPQVSPAQLDMAAQMMPMFGLGMPMPVPLSMAMAMNIQPPLMPMMFGPLVGEGNMPTTPTSMAEQAMPKQQQAAQAAQIAAQQAALNQKRARTRINDEQLKILRAHFDINNSPSEEQINAMSEQSGLPQKVIKHWFRNTLFKERQRNKDSPYNFNNPPMTTLDLEEYEKTGKIPQTIEEKSQEVTSKPIIEKESEEIQVKKEVTKPDTPTVTQFSPQQQHQDFQKQIQQLQQQQQQHLQQLKQQLQQQQSMFKEKVIDQSPLKLDTSHRESPDLSDNDYSNMSAASSIPSTSNHMPPFMMTSGSGDDIRPRFEPTPYHSGYAKRANRTRFTDYQIKVLQEYFEQNAYPKDDELDHLSQVLNLSPRVIVVWFQNARQKARKIYENQPPPETSTKESPNVNSNSPFQRTAGLNYQCKKCSAVFQRYYDLIRHQKKQCGLDSEKIQMPLHGGMEEDSDSLSTLSRDDFNDETASTNSHDVSGSGDKDQLSKIKFKCEKCHLSFDGLEHWQEHQAVHAMNPGLFGNLPSNSAFGVLQSMAAAQQQESKNLMKRKLNDSFEDKFDDDDDQPRDKRLRTTILPEQLDYLYQKYQVDCNPSRKQLETISAEVGLKKRVVQVWFQNTRARERKGQYRAHQQLIHKRCPFCRALFRAKSALESHLATKHPEEMAKGDINVDNLPDAAIEPPGSQGFGSLMTSPSDMSKLLSPHGMQSFMPGLSFNDQLQMSMKQFYEDSYKKYMSDLTSTPKDHNEREKEYETPVSSKTNSANNKSSNGGSEAPLDLSKPLKVNTDHDKHSDGPSTDISERSFEDHNISNKSFNDSISETCSNNENDDSYNISTSRSSSPLGHSAIQGKRYRTQMTSVQVRIMKSIFVDYKTPTMAECEMLGREIGLPKRVVQVWFQNARAKEKKAKLTMNKGYSAELDFPKPPEECTLCHFKYSHKYTIQDHIFTKKHIDKVKMYIQSQSDVESNLTAQGTSSSTSDALRQHQEMGRMRKAWDEAAALANSQPHLAQLQAMGLGALGLPQMPGFNPSDILKDFKKEKKDKKEKKEAESDAKSQGNNKENDVAAQLAAANFMNPFGAGFLPGMDPSMYPLMGLPGMPGFLPGMGMPFMPPGFMPGAEHLMQYDPMTFGTPLSLLQIPHQAIKDVSIKLSDPKANVAQYTQDCKSINSLKSLVNSVDYNCARESTVDVGYICKKCQTVYPAKDACIAHQKTLCYPTVPENIQPLLKLEQIQYECYLCADKWSTVQEYKLHCQGETHKAKAARLQQKSSPSKSPATGHSAVQGTTQSKDSSLTPSKFLSSSITPSPLPKNDSTGDQNEASD
ncbi:zinc finger homeobox protein 4-like [Saccostrea cucullata]|uniref:zinc finger homeobox protein 4-like n=1 Tax=Saccostrea cuccullata TaxID=36930 RepID=UPI002ED2D51B